MQNGAGFLAVFRRFRVAKCLLIFAILLQTAHTLAFDMTFDWAQNSIVHIVSSAGPWPWSSAGICTGAVVRVKYERYFITAGHCILDHDPDAVLTLAEGAFADGGSVLTKTAQTDLRVGDGMLLPDVDTFILPLRYYQLAKTRTLSARLTELEPGEKVSGLGFPQDFGPLMANCKNISGSLSRVEDRHFQPDQLVACVLPTSRMSGMSGGPIIDKNGNYVGMFDNSDHGLSVPPFFYAGFVPFRVLKPVMLNGKLTPLVYVHGFTFRDYLADPTGATSVTARYQPETQASGGHYVVSTIEIRSPHYHGMVNIKDVQTDKPIVDIALTPIQGESVSQKDLGLFAPTYGALKIMIEELGFK